VGRRLRAQQRVHHALNWARTPLPSKGDADPVDAQIGHAFPIRIAGSAGAGARRAAGLRGALAISGDAVVGAVAEQTVSQAAVVELAGTIVADEEDAAVGVGLAALVQLAAAQTNAGPREPEVAGFAATLSVVGAGLGSRAGDAASGVLAFLFGAAIARAGARFTEGLVCETAAGVAAGTAAAVNGRRTSLSLVGANALRIHRGAVCGEAVGVGAAVALPEDDLA
jgi:hypothetical protein